MKDSPAAIEFVEKLLKARGVEGVDDDVREELREELLRMLESKVNRAVVQSLNPEQLTEFEHLLDTNQLDKMAPFLEEKGVNLTSLVARCMIDLQKSYLRT